MYMYVYVCIYIYIYISILHSWAGSPLHSPASARGRKRPLMFLAPIFRREYMNLMFMLDKYVG